VVRLSGEVVGGLVILVLIVISGILYHHHWQIHWVSEPGQCATEGGTSKQILDYMKFIIYWNTLNSYSDCGMVIILGGPAFNLCHILDMSI
jgi:hypothetical protein